MKYYSMIKRIVYSIIACCLAVSVNAQGRYPENLPKLDSQVVHFGYSLGLNRMDFTFKPSADIYNFDTVFAVENKKFIGFNINMIANFRLAKYLDVRFMPGLNFGQRQLDYKIAEGGIFKTHTMTIESTFLEFPLLFKYRSKRLGNFRPYLIGGVNPRFDLASNRKIDPKEEPKIRLSRFNGYYEIGGGVDFFLEYFMFAVEVKGSFGLMNNIVYDGSEFSNIYQQLNSKMLIISFHFEGGKLDGWNIFKRK